MKTTIDIPEPLYRKAKVQAAQQGVTLREVVLGALARDLDPASRTLPRSADEPHFDIDELGLPRLRRSEDDSTVVTEAFLNQLRDQEGV